MEQFKQWRAGHLTFNSSAQPQNPFLDIVITASFTGPSGRVIKREAYWDGGNVYKVSFAPTETGDWHFELSAPAETGLDGVKGELNCVPDDSGLALYQHGFVKLANKRHLSYADGTPFFWLGDTHWGFIAGERWDESNHPQMKSMFKGMIDRRAQQGFTVYQTNLRPESFYGTHFWADGREGILPDVAFYQNEVDRRMQYLADAGLVNALGLAWGGSAAKPEAIKNLARYVVARYGALPIVWTLAGEVAGYNPAERQMLINGWREVALLIEQLDGYGHLQTAHYTNERPFADYYQNEDWFDFTLNQAGHGDYVISIRDFREHRRRFPDKPFVEGEGMYEFVHTLEENGGRVADAGMVRRVAYLAMQTGACGYTYGAQGIWDTVWEKTKELNPFMKVFNPHCITWAEAVDGQGAVQMGYLRGFYEKVGFSSLKPSTDVCKSSFFLSEDSVMSIFTPVATASEDMKTVVVYVGAISRTGGATLNKLNNGAYTLQWFNPRDNSYTTDGTNAVPENGTLPFPERPDDEDWLLVLTQNK